MVNIPVFGLRLLYRALDDFTRDNAPGYLIYQERTMNAFKQKQTLATLSINVSLR